MPVVQLTAAPDCGACERVKFRLGEIQARHPEPVIDHVDMLMDEGVALSARHRIRTLPTLFVDGAIMAEGDVESPDLAAAVGFVASAQAAT